MSAKFNLVCEQATTFNFQFSVNNDAVPINLTGYTGIMTVRPFVGSSTVTITASTDTGRLVITGGTGTVTVTLSAALTEPIVPGRYSYDLVLSGGTTVTRFLEGLFIVTGAVTL
jgi:hypothetical protein